MTGLLRRVWQRRVRPRSAGVFVTHVRGAAVERHFQRLLRESGHLIDWHFVLNDGDMPAPQTDLPVAPPERIMPARYAQMLANGGIMNGLGDTMFMPCALAAARRFVWVMEYDVDYAGHWAEFFAPFATDTTDLLTTTVTSPDSEPGWHHWTTARTPASVARTQWRRGFHPIMRASRRLIERYCAAASDPAWGGHHEFVLPTVTVASGLSLRDLRDGATSGRSHVPTYRNTPGDTLLRPGTFIWRPARTAYFHEAPDTFEERARLYHPIKTDHDGWDVAFNARRAARAGA
ncbi:hypothetical protein AA103196_2665 [Ameyamaea chiangmaiensis NBRC 103196]|uniref:Uncharacterized protein n=1 Tax=Ameyamaea chiangmaiensis TaxID=442969 RepID=A0A850PCE5_9PROT|nr:hypothetical protein [Ameyamaea chiangmaiensis]MBS4074155.1 hypothetical protein [Ameyamaea chiangmaiensis]NVN39966.1 hypothetical protein [Ameyamaea chiangmaiensis]GBQ71064.1 hypothetical protein AA103196_2665 [Ameyamaea chiangmaiensis NBRC 103196]